MKSFKIMPAHKGKPIRTLPDPSAEILKIRKEWVAIAQVLSVSTIQTSYLFNKYRHKDFLIKSQTKAIMTNGLLRRMNIHSCWKEHSPHTSYILLVGGAVQLCGFFIDFFAHKIYLLMALVCWSHFHYWILDYLSLRSNNIHFMKLDKHLVFQCSGGNICFIFLKEFSIY